MTHKQEIFCREYLLDFNAAQAAIRSGYAPRSARQIASALMQRQDISAAINAAMATRRDRLQLDADNVVRRLECIAYLDIRRLYRNGLPIPLDELPSEVTAAIVGVTCDGRYILADRLQALSMLLHHTATRGDTATQPHIRIMQQGV